MYVYKFMQFMGKNVTNKFLKQQPNLMQQCIGRKYYDPESIYP